MVNDVEPVSMCVFAICVSSSVECIHDFSHFLIELFILLLLSSLEFFLYFRH